MKRAQYIYPVKWFRTEVVNGKKTNMVKSSSVH